MSSVGEIKNSLAKTETTSLQSLIQKSAVELGKALPEHMRPERLVRIALTCIRLNPDLARCTPESFLGALFVSAQLGIEPVAGRAYLLPFNNKRQVNGQWTSVKEAQFVMGYKGLAELFFRHDKGIELAWDTVREKDDFDYEKGTNAFLRHKPAKTARGTTLGYWVMATLQGGGKPFHYMTVADCMEHAKKHSKTYDKKEGKFYSSSPWATNPDAMCLKTVLIQLAKLLPLSVELQKAIAADETSREFRQGIGDVFDMPDNAAWNEVEAEIKGQQPPTDAIEP